jgi:hypothetical protein
MSVAIGAKRLFLGGPPFAPNRVLLAALNRRLTSEKSTGMLCVQ